MLRRLGTQQSAVCAAEISCRQAGKLFRHFLHLTSGKKTGAPQIDPQNRFAGRHTARSSTQQRAIAAHRKHCVCFRKSLRIGQKASLRL